MKKRTTSVEKARAKTRVLVVDDHPFFREGLVQFLNRQPGLVCCGEAEGARQTEQAISGSKPDLVLLDLRLPDGDGLELIKTLKTRFPALPVLVLSQMDETLYAERALRAGASGYLMKEEATEEVRNAIEAIIKGELYVSRRISVLVLKRSLERKSDSKGVGVDGLTDRELQVFQLLGAGIGTRKIAERLKLSFKTIETYRENIKHKLGLRGAVELVRRATAWVQAQSHSSGAVPASLKKRPPA